MLRAEITLVYQNTSEAETILKAISPDNIQIPSDLTIETTRTGAQVFTTILCKKLGTFLVTIDDLLSCVSIAEKTFSVAKELQKST